MSNSQLYTESQALALQMEEQDFRGKWEDLVIPQSRNIGKSKLSVKANPVYYYKDCNKVVVPESNVADQFARFYYDTYKIPKKWLSALRNNLSKSKKQREEIQNVIDKAEKNLRKLKLAVSYQEDADTKAVISEEMYALKGKVDGIVSDIPFEKSFITFDPDASWYYNLDLPRKIELIFNVYEANGVNEVPFIIKQDGEIIIDDWMDLNDLKEYILKVIKG